ncbi:Hypothetical predicted protein [Mytilus galloprovincialis]|uniref:CS domain-containing protein n=1 Tax=Mytilus galloprovincialis TaxID=29158 RepID=A0A8B6E1I5_MYTGA|nr:Hypothetical predicted protein [Mytilus galloprovincialis]VDI28306.1 Hypothetical predicted protein [Mytilus galloprovincialis]
MAEGEEFRIPTVTAEEIDLTTIRAVVIIPDLEVTSKVFGAAKPKKNATVVPKFENNSFEVTAVVKKKEKENKFRYTVKKLPGDIVPEKCKTEYKKEQVILLLHKAEESSWAVQLSKRGLEQAED